ncbi:MAG: glycosyltransferase family A protein [Sterolibacterium sp.]|nr:glycosyltransferase family A protein [Sterolibacterium sp.]
MGNSANSILLILPEDAETSVTDLVLRVFTQPALRDAFPLRVLSTRVPVEAMPGVEWHTLGESLGKPWRRKLAVWRFLRGEYSRRPFKFVITLATDDQHAAGWWRATALPQVFNLRLWMQAESLRRSLLSRITLNRQTAANVFLTPAIAHDMGSSGNHDLWLDNPFILQGATLADEENIASLKAALEAMSQPTRERGNLKPAVDSSHIRLTYITHYYLNQNRTETITALLEAYAAYAPDLLDRIHFVVVDDGSPLKLTPPKLDLNLTWLRIREDIRWNQGGARNLGATYAKSDNVLLTDLDLHFPEPTLRALVDAKPCGKNIFKFMERDRATGQLRKGHPNTFFLSRARFLRFYGYDEEFTGNYGAEDFRFVKFQKAQGSRQRYFDRRYTYFVRTEIDRKTAYHSLKRDLSQNTPLDSRKRFENECYGHECGHSRMFLDFTWDILCQSRRENVPRLVQDRGWKRRWLLRTLLPWR